LGILEAEARAKGISVPELFRRIIVERNQGIEGVQTTQVAPSPRSLTTISPSKSPRIKTPTSSPVNPSQTEAALKTTGEAILWAQLVARVPELAPTKAMKLAREGLAKYARKNPDEFLKSIAEQFARGELSKQELTKLLALSGLLE
jgi:hypothetical protein